MNVRKFLLSTLTTVLSVVLVLTVCNANAVQLQSRHASLDGMLGLPSIIPPIDTGWLDINILGIGGGVRFGGSIGGTLAQTRNNGNVRITYSSYPGTGQISFAPISSGSFAQMNVGFQTIAKYRLFSGPVQVEGNLPIPNIDALLSKRKALSDYRLGSNVILEANLDNKQLIDYPIGLPPVASVNIGVSLSSTCKQTLRGSSLDSSVGSFAISSLTRSTQVNGSGTTITGISETWHTQTALSFTPKITISANVLFIGTDKIGLEIVTIPVPLSPATFTTTPARSVSFTYPRATITVDSSPPDGGDVGGGGTYYAGESLQISASAKPGWTFSGWSDGNSQNLRTLIVPDHDTTYTARFRILEAALPPVPSPMLSTYVASGTPTWSWLPGGGDGTGRYRFKLNDADLSSGATETTDPYYTPTSPLAEGRHTLYVQEKDALGNWSEVTELTIVVDQSGPQIIRVAPINQAGIDIDGRVPNNTSFGVLVQDAGGVDVADPEALTFNVQVAVADNASGHDVVRNASDEPVRVIPLELSELGEGAVATTYWAVYDKLTDIVAAYPFDATVAVNVAIKDKAGNSTEESYAFRVESALQHDEANNPANLPPTVVTIDGQSTIVAVNDGDLQGARLVFMTGEPVEPNFGPLDDDDLPALDIADGVGVPLNLKPPTVFNKPVTIYVPCPGYESVDDLNIYYYDGDQWVLACNATGQIQSDGEGWMVPGSRRNHNSSDDPANDPSTIEIQVYQLSIVQAGADSPGGCDLPWGPWRR